MFACSVYILCFHVQYLISAFMSKAYSILSFYLTYILQLFKCRSSLKYKAIRRYSMGSHLEVHPSQLLRTVKQYICNAYYMYLFYLASVWWPCTFLSFLRYNVLTLIDESSLRTVQIRQLLYVFIAYDAYTMVIYMSFFLRYKVIGYFSMDCHFMPIPSGLLRRVGQYKFDTYHMLSLYLASFAAHILSLFR